MPAGVWRPRLHDLFEPVRNVRNGDRSLYLRGRKHGASAADCQIFAQSVDPSHEGSGTRPNCSVPEELHFQQKSAPGLGRLRSRNHPRSANRRRWKTSPGVRAH
uniref:(northern house mosquito) hypothetical protein n=1 Tax=Culex pipiens TaxID=7175 RepID=A0A8D8BCK9_CULPI